MYGEKPFRDPNGKTLSEWQAEKGVDKSPIVKLGLMDFNARDVGY